MDDTSIASVAAQCTEALILYSGDKDWHMHDAARHDKDHRLSPRCCAADADGMLLLRHPYGEEKTFALIPHGRPASASPTCAGGDAGDDDATPVGRLPADFPESNHFAPSDRYDVPNPSTGHLHHAGPSHRVALTVAKRHREKRKKALERLTRLEGSIMAETTTHANGKAVNGETPKKTNGHGRQSGYATTSHLMVSRPPQTRDSDDQVSRTSSSRTPSSRTSNGAHTMRHSRSPSNPLAPPFIVSAPGKTIVYGEHAVVHGKAAIAASISLRSYLLVTTLSKSQRYVKLQFTDIGLDHTWQICDLPWKEFAPKKKKYYDLVTNLDSELFEIMQPHIQDISPDAEPEKRKIHQAAASAFLYLFLSLGSDKSPGCVYAMRSCIPIGAGLGSSASVSVCIAAALLIQSRALSGPHPDQQSEEAEKQLERINRWAFVGELLIHGNPSGVDNTVSTNGHAVLFQRKDYTKPPSVSVIRDFPELPLLLVDTCQPKSTAAEVAKVGSLKKTHPLVVENILNAIDSITRSVYERLESDDFDSGSRENIQHLGELMTINHGLLTSLGVSHPRLERLRYLVDQAGVGWTKLTGAGGGGCAITLLNPDVAATTNGQPNGDSQLNGGAKYSKDGDKLSPMEQLDRNLKEEGFIKYATTLGGDGVGVLYPAVINDEEIDLELFLTVEGREGVEELVSEKGDDEVWKYWPQEQTWRERNFCITHDLHNSGSAHETTIDLTRNWKTRLPVAPRTCRCSSVRALIVTSIRRFLIPPSHLLPLHGPHSNIRHRDRTVADKEVGKVSDHSRISMFCLSSSRGD
ncbi:Mevalonate kinase [Cercospora zeina]